MWAAWPRPSLRQALRAARDTANTGHGDKLLALALLPRRGLRLGSLRSGQCALPSSFCAVVRAAIVFGQAKVQSPALRRTLDGTETLAGFQTAPPARFQRRISPERLVAPALGERGASAARLSNPVFASQRPALFPTVPRSLLRGATSDRRAGEAMRDIFSWPLFGRRRFDSLSAEEILALAIAAEEEDSRIYALYARRLRENYPATARMFESMAEEENAHRSRLTELYRARYCDIILPIRREHVADFFVRRPVWLIETLPLERIRAEAAAMEREAETFYRRAAERTTDAQVRALLGDLAAAEARHELAVAAMREELAASGAASEEDLVARRQFILTWVQPGLAGLMDGSVSTLAPIFATAFATQDPWTTFLVGLSASVGAGISMGFTEAAHDDGKLSGRGSPVKRGLASGVMTAIGGLGHALPYLIPHFWTATAIALAVVFVELWAIAWIQNRYMETPWRRAVFQVVLGGSLVLAAGILIGGG